MALFINQENTRTKLQQKVANDLAEKAKKRAIEERDRPDGVEDSEYLKNSKRTTSLAWVWVVIIVVAMALSIWLVVISS